jgi:hypothetical protein
MRGTLTRRKFFSQAGAGAVLAATGAGLHGSPAPGLASTLKTQPDFGHPSPVIERAPAVGNLNLTVSFVVERLRSGDLTR